MGYLGVKTLVAHLAARRSSGASTPACTSSPASDGWTGDREELLQPDLSKWNNDRAPPRFEMRGIRKAFGATVALDGVDLAVRRARSARSSARTAPARAR